MKRINADIEQQSFHKMYLLYGEERYLKNQYTNRLMNALCNPEDRMNTHYYEGKDLPVGAIIDLAETMPFLAPRRAIFIKNSGLFKSGGEAMAEYLNDPCESTCFVFTEAEVDKRSKLFKSLSNNGLVVEFTTQDENTLIRWIRSLAAKDNINLDPQTASYLLSKTGMDMENIQMEMEKLLCYCMGQDKITMQDVDSICVTRTQNHIFDMITAVSAKQMTKALALYNELLTLREPPLRIISLISRHYNILMQAKELKKKGFSDKDISGKIGIPSFTVGKYLAQASKYKMSDLRRALQECVSADEAIKTGTLDNTLSVEVLLFTLSDQGAQ